MNKREFLKAMLAGGASLFLNKKPVFAQDHQLDPSPPLFQEQLRRLPSVKVNPFSSEIVLNSRYSFHGGYSGGLPIQVLANVLWAAGKAPVAGSFRTIYVATPNNVYRYDEKHHCLFLHRSGNQLSEGNLAFEVGIAGELEEDAGACIHYAHLAGMSFWTTTNNQPSCCPKESGTTNANSRWNPDSSIHMVTCHGRMNNVNGITNQLVAVSSDGSLPDPSTEGTVLMENAMADLNHGDQFASTELSLNDLSQIAWASYGCTPHNAAGGRAALTVASAVANYYLAGKIYIVRPAGVERYHCRLPSGSHNTRDHRIERVTTGDVRSALRAAVPRLPETAPHYFVYCSSSTSRWQLLEAGFCGSSALLQATAIDLQGYITAGFSSAERSGIINALGIPSNHYPMLVFSTGHAS